MLELILPLLLMVIFLFLWHWKLEKIIKKAILKHLHENSPEVILINPYHPDDPKWEEFENKYIKD